MRKWVAALMLAAAVALPAGAQWQVPARQVLVATNEFEVVCTEGTSSRGVTVLPTGFTGTYPLRIDSLQYVLEWLDVNWTSGLLNTNDWDWLAPSTNTPQSVFDFIDDWGYGYSTNGGWLAGSNIVGATFIDGQWTGLMPGTNIEGAVYNSTSLTWTVDAGLGSSDSTYTNVFTGSGTSYSCTNFAYSADTVFRYLFVGAVYNPTVTSNVFDMALSFRRRGDSGFFGRVAEFRGLPLYTFEISSSIPTLYTVTTSTNREEYLAMPYAACYIFDTADPYGGEFNRIVSVSNTTVTLESALVTTGADRIQACGGIGSVGIPDGLVDVYLTTSVSSPGGAFHMKYRSTSEGRVVEAERGW